MQSRILKPLTSVVLMNLVVALSVSSCVVQQLVGDVLSPIRDEINKVLADATASGNALLVTAAGQLDLAASNTESAFAADLNKAIDSVDTSVRARLDQLKLYADQMNNSVNKDLNVVIDGSQQIINSLPFTNKNPQVRSYAPAYRSGNSQDPLQVTVNGNFFWADQQKTAVTMSINGDTIQPNLTTTTKVGFAVPAKYFSATTNSFTPTSFVLSAPYEQGVVFKSIQPGRFHILVTTLPGQPLKALRLKNTSTVDGIESVQQVQPTDQAKNRQGWRVESWSSCTDQQDSHTISADPGWTIVPNSVEIGYDARGYAPRGNASVVSSSPTGFVVVGKTEANCPVNFLGVKVSSQSGDITYYVSYTEQRHTSTTKEETRDLLAAPNPSLSWGGQIITPVTKGGWSLHAELWDGTVLEFPGAVSSNPYLTVVDQGNSVGIALTAPAELGLG